MKIREIYYTGQRNSQGQLTYQKFLEDGTQVFETLEDIYCDPEFEALVDGLC